ncbi:MAG: putative ABC transporter permease [Eubacteriales bacterium]
MTYVDLVLLLIIYSFLGWCCETVYCSVDQKKFVERGFLTGPFCPIYGFGAIFVLLFLSQSSSSVISVFAIGVLITSTLEYVTSWLMEKIFDNKWWDYSDKKYHINGRVCLLNSTLFGMLCLYVYFDLNPWILNLLDSYNDDFKMGFLVALSMYLIVDFSVATYTALGIKKYLQELSAKKDELIEKHNELEERIREELINDEMEAFIREGKQKIKFLEKRLLLAFPNIKNKKHQENLSRIRNFLKNKQIKKIKDKG